MKDCSEQINAIRRAAGNPLVQCPTCCRAPETPFRAYDERGKVMHGCIDPIHTAHLVSPSESFRWHMTAAARKWRAEMLANLRGKK